MGGSQPPRKENRTTHSWWQIWNDQSHQIWRDYAFKRDKTCQSQPLLARENNLWGMWRNSPCMLWLGSWRRSTQLTLQLNMSKKLLTSMKPQMVESYLRWRGVQPTAGWGITYSKTGAHGGQMTVIFWIWTWTDTNSPFVIAMAGMWELTLDLSSF